MLKLPQNLLESPYTIITAGTICQPQRLAFPFSIVSAQQSSSSSSSTSIAPGWVFWANPYMLARAQIKFSTRRKSKVYRTDFPVLRPSVVRMIIAARNALKSVSCTRISSVYTEEQLPTLGKCWMTEENRARGEEAYTSIIRLYCARVSSYI